MSDMDYKKIETETQSVYKKNAKAYDQERGRSLFEKQYLDKIIRLLADQPKVLDLGCGAGEPIAKYLIENSCLLDGADYSEAMLKICREKFPEQHWYFADMRNIDLPKKYDGIISWGAYFHLNQDEQRDCLAKLCQNLNLNGILMITVGHEEGEVTGTVVGQKVYHSSLSKDEYIEILNRNSMKVVEFNLQDPACHGFSVFIARKTS
jgi:SAM-dependent methyltransferase